jgi:transcriptional regulator with XRE-family HTH domain
VHSLRQLIQSQCDTRGWKQADLARASKLSPQLVNRLWNDDRDQLTEMPTRTTMSALAAAFALPEHTVLMAAARAYGIPVDAPVAVGDPSLIDDLELLAELGRRLADRQPAATSSDEGGNRDVGSPKTPADDRSNVVAGRFQPPPMPDLTEPYVAAAYTDPEPTKRQKLAQNDPDNFGDDPSPED